MLQEQAQQLKFLECQLHTLPICRDGVRVEVDRNATALQKMRRCLHLAAAKDRLHAGDKLHDPEGLCEIVVRAQVQTLNFIVFRALGRRHDDGDAGKSRGGLHPAQKLDAVESWEHHVEHDKLGHFLLQGVPECLPVLKASGLKAGRLQSVDLNVADAGVIFHTPDHVSPSLCTPVTEKTTHWAMFTAWSAMRSKYLAIIRQSRKYAPSSGCLEIFSMRDCLTSSK